MRYKLIGNDCDGIQFVIELVHKKVFAPEEFQILCEDAIVSAIEKHARDNKYASTSTFDEKELILKLQEKGFSLDKDEEVVYKYEVHPFNAKYCYENKKLIAWGNKKTTKKYPSYFEKEVEKR